MSSDRIKHRLYISNNHYNILVYYYCYKIVDSNNSDNSNNSNSNNNSNNGSNHNNSITSFLLGGLPNDPL